MNPERRYPSASEFASDLNAFLEGKTTVAEAMPPEDEDPEATRRTSRSIETEEPDEAATRRTAAPPRSAVTPEPLRAKPVVRKTKPPLTPRQRQIRFFASLALLILMLLLVFTESPRGEAGRSSRARSNPSVSPTWTRHGSVTKLSRRPASFRCCSPRPGTRFSRKLISTADTVINEYRRSDAPNVTEKEWIRAHDVLARALQIDPSNRDVRGKLYLTEGPPRAEFAAPAASDGKLLNDARAKFEQAAELTPAVARSVSWARHASTPYSLHDVDRAEDGVKAADKRGHEMGRRERAQLADGYRYRGERLMREAVKALPVCPKRRICSSAQRRTFNAPKICTRTSFPRATRPPTSGECLKISMSSTRAATR